MVRLFMLLVATACAQRAPLAPAAPPPAVDLTRALAAGPATAVVTLAPDTPSAVLRGPFAVTSINPGGDLTLALAARACDEPGLLWFGYSGGGVAVAAGQTLCARSAQPAPRVQAFSGRHDAP